MSALLSGEMRDTVEITAAGVYLLERYFSKSERAKLFRSWAGAVSRPPGSLVARPELTPLRRLR